ncbi:MAG: AbrB family transcriptional regulator [Natronospirillum sp.]
MGKALILAVVGGLVAHWLSIPLAWMIGPLLTVGVARMLGLDLQSVPGGRQLGQSAVGVAVGLQMTPSVMDFLMQEIGLILISGGVTVLMGWPMAVLLQRLSREDAKTCYFSAVPGGLSEMAVLGARYGAQVEPIAIAQTMRLAMIVLIVPPFMAYSGFTGASLNTPSGVMIIAWPTTALFSVAAIALSFIFNRLKVSNAWILGGIVTGCCIALVGRQALGLPVLAINTAQFLLGLGLGVMFNRDFVTRAPKFMRAVALVMLVMLALAWGAAALVAQVTEHDFGTLFLGFAPAGVTEMVLTAKALGFEAPLITAIHLARIFLIVLFAAALFRLTMAEKAPSL